jgi:hypothetical protein
MVCQEVDATTFQQGMFVDGGIQLMGAITALCSTGML